MKRILALMLCVLITGLALSVAGCARGGEQQPVVPAAVLEVYIRFARAVNDAFYYFAAFDADGDFGVDGPLPVAAGPRWGNGWGTGSITHFVEYHQGRYELYRTILTPQLLEAGGGITGAAGVPATTDAGQHTITVGAISFGAATVNDPGTVAAVTNNGFQAAGDLSIETDAAGRVLAGSVVFTASATGGRPLTAAEQAAVDALNAGGVALAADSLDALGLALTIASPPVAGAQTITIAQTTAEATDRFQPEGTSPPPPTQFALPANTDLPLAGGPLSGMSLVTGDLVTGGTARVSLQPAVNATPLGVPYEYVLPQGRDALQFTLDLQQLGVDYADLSINFISTTELIFDPTVVNPDDHVYDGLGLLGNNYFTIQTNQYQTLRNQDSFVVEGPDDPTLVGPGSDTDKQSVDIVDWRVTLRRLR